MGVRPSHGRNFGSLSGVGRSRWLVVSSADLRCHPALLRRTDPPPKGLHPGLWPTRDGLRLVVAGHPYRGRLGPSGRLFGVSGRRVGQTLKTDYSPNYGSSMNFQPTEEEK